MPRRALLVPAVLSLLACGGEPAPQPPPPESSTSPPSAEEGVLRPQATAALVADPAASKEAVEADLATYAWDLFVYLNQPLEGTDPKLWEGWRQTSTVYLPDGSRPAPWGEEPPIEPPAETPVCAPAGGVWHNLDTDLQVDGLVLRDAWNGIVRYQLLMNRPTFDYILDRGFYNVNGQEAAAQAGEPADFPWDAYELKTSWIWIDDEETCQALSGKYYIVDAFFQAFDNDGEPTHLEYGAAALTGMHIINKTLPQWVWITFENVHNETYTQATLELPIPEDAQAANEDFREELEEIGSIFANYELIGTQIHFTDPATGEATLLANSNIESAFQPQSSCITCHGTASISGQGRYFDFVDDSGGNIAYHVGDPPSLAGFNPLDFVWSMKRASRER